MSLLTITQMEHGNKLRENDYFMQMLFPLLHIHAHYKYKNGKAPSYFAKHSVLPHTIVLTPMTRGLSGCVFWD